VARPDEHFEQARQNRAFAEHLLATYPNNPVFMQWAVTASFYAALHCMTGYLVQHGVQVFNHQARDAELARLTNNGTIPFAVYDAYVKLKRRSTGARYELRQFSEQQVRTQILDGYLATIASFVGL
jgi:hypothetical protein